MPEHHNDIEDFTSSVAIAISRTGSFDLDMTPDEALPLFTAPGEKLWISGWNPVVLGGDGVEKGTVFVTSHHGHVTHWLVMDYDSANRNALYVRVTPGVDAGTVEVSIVSNGMGGSRVSVSYRLTALGPAGNDILRKSFSELEYARMMEDWRAMITANLDRINQHFSY